MVGLNTSTLPTVTRPSLAALVRAFLFPKPAASKLPGPAQQPGGLMVVAVESQGARYLLSQLELDLNQPSEMTPTGLELPQLRALVGFLPGVVSYVLLDGNQRKTLVEYVNFYWLRAIESGDQHRMVAYDQLLDELFFAQTSPPQAL